MKKKTVRLRVVLKNVAPKTAKKLRSIGMDEQLSLMTQEISFTDERGRGFDTPTFAIALLEAKERLISEVVECKVEEL